MTFAELMPHIDALEMYEKRELLRRLEIVIQNHDFPSSSTIVWGRVEGERTVDCSPRLAENFAPAKHPRS